MGVINMAHGELVMIGAYATYEVQMYFGHSPENSVNEYYFLPCPLLLLPPPLLLTFDGKICGSTFI